MQSALRHAGYVDAFAVRTPAAAGARGGGGADGTSRALPPRTCWTRTRLDYILLSPQALTSLRVGAHETLESDASDHMPVACELQLLE